jgi:hypothetical protein
MVRFLLGSSIGKLSCQVAAIVRFIDWVRCYRGPPSSWLRADWGLRARNSWEGIDWFRRRSLADILLELDVFQGVGMGRKRAWIAAMAGRL